MTSTITKVQFIAEYEDLEAFLEHLDDADNDLSQVIYWAAFDARSVASLEEFSADIERLVGPPVTAVHHASPETESYEWRYSLTLTLVHERSLLREMICVGTLFGFETGVWITDRATGVTEHFSL